MQGVTKLIATFSALVTKKNMVFQFSQNLVDSLYLRCLVFLKKGLKNQTCWKRADFSLFKLNEYIKVLGEISVFSKHLNWLL